MEENAFPALPSNFFDLSPIFKQGGQKQSPLNKRGDTMVTPSPLLLNFQKLGLVAGRNHPDVSPIIPSQLQKQS